MGAEASRTEGQREAETSGPCRVIIWTFISVSMVCRGRVTRAPTFGRDGGIMSGEIGAICPSTML